MALDIGRRTLTHAAREAAWSGERTPSVVVVGAGLSGLALGAQLARSGVRTFTIVEQSEGVGGTWRDNTYPGCGCDVPSHLYSLSFARKPDWTRRYADQPEILDYAESFVERFGLGPHLRLGTRVMAARLDEHSGDWEIELCATDGGGTAEVVHADAVVFACGQLGRPHVPDLPGLGTFAGPSWHSARWDHSVDLAGKRVAVVGSGASAIQFVPAIAERCEHLTVFERSPAYVVPRKDRAYGLAERRLFARVRAYELAYRWSLYWSLEARWFAFRRDSWASRALTGALAKQLRAQVVSDRLPERSVVPDYPVGCKRILVSSDWYPALLRNDVSLVDVPIERVEADAVVTADGTCHGADVLVFGTGFETTDFLGAIPVRGLSGRLLADEWSDGARAYRGIAVAGFPNCYLLYGPNTNLGHNSILFMVERQINLVLQALALQTRALAQTRARMAAASTDGPSGGRSGALVGVTEEAYRADDTRTQRMMSRTAWVANCRSWYKNAAGRVVNNWPSWTVRYWLETLRLRESELGIEPPAAPSEGQDPMCSAGTVPSRPA